MSGLDWSILRDQGPVDITSNFARGYKFADDIISTIHEKQALGALAQQPDDRNALAKLYQTNPQMASHFERMNAARQAAQQQQEGAELGYRFTQDPEAAQQEAVGRGRFDIATEFAKLSKADQERTAKLWTENIGPVAFALSQKTNPAERDALWREVRPELERRGVPAEKLNQFDPQNNTQIEATLTTTQTIKDLIDQNSLKWITPGETGAFAVNGMGRPVGSQNPYAQRGGSAAPAPSGPPGDGTSYYDPVHTPIADAMEQKHGLPPGLLDSIRLKGERSNADQVSPAGARGVYQFIPETRAAFLKKYGVDAWAGPEQAAEAAALHLKESYERTGSWDRAVTEYIGGPSPERWGSQTRAYSQRVGQNWDEGGPPPPQNASAAEGRGANIDTGRKDPGQLRAEAAAAIAAGADPARVNARLSELLGGSEGNNFSRLMPMAVSTPYGVRL